MTQATLHYPKPGKTQPKDAQGQNAEDRQGTNQQRQIATILTLDPPIAQLTFQFNPNQIKFSKTTSWNSQTDKAGAGGKRAGRGSEPKRNVPTSEFQGGNAQTLAMDLLFDTTETGNDVRVYTDFLVSLTLINPKTDRKKPRPSLVKFIWGNFSQKNPSAGDTRSVTSFNAYIKDVNINFTLFNMDGTPLRAETQITLTAFQDNGTLPFQNPTSRSEARSMYVVNAGDTLDYIAYKELGNSNLWRHIADSNQLINPMKLKPGTVLKLVPPME